MNYVLQQKKQVCIIQDRLDHAQSMVKKFKNSVVRSYYLKKQNELNTELYMAETKLIALQELNRMEMQSDVPETVQIK